MLTPEELSLACQNLSPGDEDTINQSLSYDLLKIDSTWVSAGGTADPAAIANTLNGIESAVLAQEYRDQIASDTNGAIDVGDRPNHPRPTK